MKNQVFMSPNNGALCVGVPLFKKLENEELELVSGYSISLRVTPDEPLAYALDIGTSATIVAAEWVHSHLECLGDL